MSKFKNPVDIPAGHTVYAARRELSTEHLVLMTVSTHKVIKRTPTGYKLASRYAHNGALLFSDADYYISTERADVARALLEDCRELCRQQQDLMQRLQDRKAALSADVYGEDHE